MVPETSSQQIQENESAHELHLFRFGCNRGNCWRRNNESHRSGGDFRSWFNRQTASEMKNLKSKIEMSKFAFTTYEKTLSDLRFALRGGNFDRTEFLSSMEAIDGIVIDLGLDWEKFENEWKEKFSTADEI